MNLKRISIVFALITVVALIATNAFAAKADEDNRQKLVGTWVCDVAGEPAFQALHTFHADGTFNETSSLLGQGQEGPAQGVWKRDGNHYQLTFQLFAFDPETGESTGMIRVRVSLKLDKPDHIRGTFAVADLIDLDGTITELGGGPDPYTCTRINVVPAQ
jgi:hypothetical protein